MIKWKAFNSLLNKNDILEIENSRNYIKRPIIMEDEEIKINYLIIKSLEEKINVEIKHYKNGLLLFTRGVIEKINKYEKYILINNTRIYFKNLIKVKEL